MNPFLLVILMVYSCQALFAQSFEGSFDFIAAQEYENGNSRSDTISYYIGESKTALIIHAQGNQPDLRLLFNEADSTITNLYELNGKKGGYILPMNQKYWPAMDYALRDYGTGPRMQLDMTGEQKEINGYRCREMRCNTEEFEGSLWIAGEIEMNLIQVLAYQTVGAGEDTEAVDMLANCGVQGFAIQAHLRLFRNNTSVSLSVINLSHSYDEARFSTEGHTLSDMRK